MRLPLILRVLLTLLCILCATPHWSVGQQQAVTPTKNDQTTSEGSQAQPKPQQLPIKSSQGSDESKNTASDSVEKASSQPQQTGQFVSPPNSQLPGTTSGQTNQAAATNDTQAKTTAPSGIVISEILSNTWNSSKFLEVTDPQLQFFTNIDFDGTSKNSTESTPDILYVDIQPTRQYQVMEGLGAGLTDASAIVLKDLKDAREDAYWEILNLCFSESPEWLARGGPGMNLIRAPIGASDFGFTEYTYDDTFDGSTDPQLTQFNIEKSAKRWEIFKDIQTVQPNLQVMFTPWSSPAWMKGHFNGSLRGGSLLEKFEESFVDYMVKFTDEVTTKKNIRVKKLSLQNEPLYDGANYPCQKMEAPQQARVGQLLRKKLDAAGYKDVGLLTYDHNWDKKDYGIDVFDRAANAFDGIAWHCYGGQPDRQNPFNVAYPNKEVWFTECTRITQNYEEPWINTRKQFSLLLAGSIDYMTSAVVLWNVALLSTEDGFTLPQLPGTCRNCLAPILVFQNSTKDGTNLTGLNMDAIRTQVKAGDKEVSPVPPILANGIQQASTAQSAPSTTAEKKSDQSQPQSSTNSRRSLTAKTVLRGKKDAKENHRRAFSGKQKRQDRAPTNFYPGNTPYIRPYYRMTSDFVTLSHLGRAIRPRNARGSQKWGQRIGVKTSEDNFDSPRLFAQMFRTDNADSQGNSRWSLILLQQNDHFLTGVYEDATIMIRFRDAVANITLPPGVFTLSWLAPREGTSSSSDT